MMQEKQLIPHLFRSEFSKIVAVLCRRFGFAYMEIAEDIAAETFLAATQAWPMNGVPANPVAWLYAVAKNKAKVALQRDTIFESKVLPALKDATINIEDYDIDLSRQNISDSQLQMMFAICHPAIAPEAQVGLSLRILCGFGIDEIAEAFLSNKETINKRLYRAKEKLRTENIRITFPGFAEIDKRLETVLTTLYLLFSEGYYSASQNQTVNKDLCFEAMRLCQMLTENPSTDKPQVNALLALMCFHSSRFDARVDKHGELILYHEQDTTLWDMELVTKGGHYLSRSTCGNNLSKYHLQATIAYWNTQHADTAEKWESILQLYNRLLQIDYSPIAALNRTYALAKANGKEVAIIEAEKLKLVNNHFYFNLLGELYTGLNNETAIANYNKALTLATTATDKRLIAKRLEALANAIPQ